MNRWRSALVCPVCLVCFVFAVGVARTSLAAGNASADELFRRGREAMDRGDCPAALTLLRESHAAEPGRGKLLNIAICEEKTGQLATAERHFREVETQLEKKDDRRPIVEEHLRGLAPKVPHLRLRWADDAPHTATVTLGGVAVPPEDIGADLAVDPGEVLVTATFPGETEARYRLTIEEGKRAELVLGPGNTTSSRSLWPVVGLIAGASLVAGGGVASVVQQEGKRAEAAELRSAILADRRSCVADAKNFDKDRCAVLQGTTATGDQWGTGGAVLFAAAGALAASAAVYALWPGGRNVGAARLPVVVTPVIATGTDHGAGLTVTGRF